MSSEAGRTRAGALIDTHCHLSSPDLLNNSAGVLTRARAAGVLGICCVATTPADARVIMEHFVAQRDVYLIAGIHPHDAGKAAEADFAALQQLHRGEALPDAWNGRLVGLGETGLDFHYDFAPREVQESVFRRQLELAIEVKRPVTIHARNSEQRCCEIIEEYPALDGRVVFHCFSQGVEIARRIVERGNFLSFTGVVTFKNADLVRESARFVPIEQVMVETDAPYLSPVPVRSVKPNEPAFVAHTARFLADVRELSFEEFAARTTANARRFFQLPD